MTRRSFFYAIGAAILTAAIFPIDLFKKKEPFLVNKSFHSEPIICGDNSYEKWLGFPQDSIVDGTSSKNL